MQSATSIKADYTLSESCLVPDEPSEFRSMVGPVGNLLPAILQLEYRGLENCQLNNVCIESDGHPCV